MARPQLLAALREALERAQGEAQRRRVQRELADLEQKIALRLEGLRRGGSL